MKNAVKFAAAASILSAAAAIQQPAAAGSLKVGMAPPPIKVAKWVKGTPVAKFEPGKVYVVEFWATWCGPCKVSIPHLTEMAKKFAGKVTFTGVSVWEDHDSAKTGSTAYMKTVDDFVKNMGEKMAYNVAVDDPKGTMAETWMTAAEQNGIPAAFVIDQQSKVAWIGHPMDGLEGVLEKVVAGKFDPAAAAKDKDAKAAAGKQLQQDVMKAQGLMEQGNIKEGFAILDGIAAKQPMFKKPIQMMKFQALTRKDEPQAYKFAKEMSEGEFKADAMGLNQIAWTIAEGKGLKSPDYGVAVEIARKAVELTKNADGMIMDTLGLALFKSGKVDEAIEVQTKAVALLAKAGPEIDETNRKEIKDRLEEFKKAKK